MLNGIYYGYKEDNKKATTSFLEGIKLGEEGKEKLDLSYTHQEYSKYLFKQGNYKKAYENLVLYDKITVDLFNKERIKRLIWLELISS